MDHVVASSTNTPKVLIPVRGIFAHEFGNDGEDGQRWEGQFSAIEFKSWGNINIIQGSLCGLDLSGVRFGQFGERLIGGIEGKGSRAMNWDGDFDGPVEVRLESASRSATN
jgi:hypothetical protein